MSSLCIELSPSAERSLSLMNEEERRLFDLKLAAQVALLLPKNMDRQQAIRGLRDIAGRAEARARAAGMTMEELNRMIDESK
jgi:hypothetical protein